MAGNSKKETPASVYLAGVYLVRDHGFEPWTQGLRIEFFPP
jgi:hypothetical protein